MNGHVEQLGALPQPMFGNQQVAGTGDRQELGDAFDDAQQNGVDQVSHCLLVNFPDSTTHNTANKHNNITGQLPTRA